MRVIAPAVDVVDTHRLVGLPSRRLTLERAGLAASTLTVLFGLWLVYAAKTSEFAAITSGLADGSVVDLGSLRDSRPLLPLLTMFADGFERRAAADALYHRAVDGTGLDRAGALTAVTLPAAQIDHEPRLVTLRDRLAEHPRLQHVPVLTTADVTAIKPHVVVRTPAAYSKAILIAVAMLVGAFWIVHAIRWRLGADDDPIVLPALLLLCGIGLASMISLRDPVRDTLLAAPFAQGVAAGCLLFLAASRLDLEASPMRRAVVLPLGVALVLASLLLVFGSGPGTSGAKVNLFGAQPVEAIRLLVVLALAAYFARRLEYLRELSEPPTAARPWLKYVNAPRWRDLRPVLASMGLVLVFFFLQKDLGPALVLSCVFLALYGMARGRAALVVAGVAMLIAGFAAAYETGFPSTVRQRVAIWLDPWGNGLAGGDQVAHGLWALATGATWGSGPGLGDPQSIPASHTDLVLAAVGEELGFVGLATVVALYGLLWWRATRIAARAPGDYTTFVAAGAALTLVVQASVIAAGVLGLLPLSGVVTPFLSYGRSSMLANFAAVGVVMGIATRRGRVRAHLAPQLTVIGSAMAIVAVLAIGRAAWVQVVHADALASAASLVEQRDGGYRYEYNPRLIAASRSIRRGTIYDRQGIPLATSRPDEAADVGARYRSAGITPLQSCDADTPRCYPLAGAAFHVLGDWTTQLNWAASNSSYVERDSDARLKGFDDRPKVVAVVNRRSGATEHAIKRDYSALLPLVRGAAPTPETVVSGAIRAERDVRLTLDARLQSRVAAALRAGIESRHQARGAAVVLDASNGDVLAAVSYPWPSAEELSSTRADVAEASHREAASDRRSLLGDSRMASAKRSATTISGVDRLLDRTRYGLYPPGSTFKLLVAGAALRANTTSPDTTYACVRLPDQRVGTYLPGIPRPIRDDPTDTTPHGAVDLRRGLIVSCNAYFAQLAMRLGPRPLLDAASLFQIEMAQPNTQASLRWALPQAGYGQGQVLVSPLKMARLVAAIAHNGAVPAVRWIRRDAADAHPDAAEQRFLSAGDAALLSRYMREVVTLGTGRTLASNPTPIAGKTGTAEVANGAAHSWFAGFAPFGGSSRKIAFAVIVENAGYGARSAAPIAGEIVTAAREIGLIK